MRAREFIVEAKPENLGQGMLDKMYAAWLYRDANDMDEEEQSDYMDDEAQVDEFEYSLEPYDGQTVKIRKFNYSGNEYRIVIEAGGNFTTFHDSGQHLPAYLTDIHF